MGFMVDEAALRQVFSEYFDFYLYVLLHKCSVFTHLSPKPYNLSNSFNNANIPEERTCQLHLCESRNLWKPDVHMKGRR